MVIMTTTKKTQTTTVITEIMDTTSNMPELIPLSLEKALIPEHISKAQMIQIREGFRTGNYIACSETDTKYYYEVYLKAISKNKVVGSCSCPDFKYRKQEVSQPCKHLLALILKKHSKIMLLPRSQIAPNRRY